jgi:hypothetical protein
LEFPLPDAVTVLVYTAALLMEWTPLQEGGVHSINNALTTDDVYAHGAIGYKQPSEGSTANGKKP